MERMGNPCSSIPAIQIIGTNGKGSIASFLRSGLKSSGIKAGITTSPHLTSWCERICTDDGPIEAKELTRILKALNPIAKSTQLSTFEFLIAAAFKHFEEKKS